MPDGDRHEKGWDLWREKGRELTLGLGEEFGILGGWEVDWKSL